MRRKPESLSEAENRVLQSAIDRLAIAENSVEGLEKEAKLGDKIADGLARVGGSWTFILTFVLFLIFWAVANAWLLGRESFDPYPFIFLNLVLSMLAALQAPVIMMSQNRQAERDRRAAQHDYEVNLKAEIEIMALHEKIDALRDTEIALLRAEVTRLLEAVRALNCGAADK
jgi:uncharacterized membrane protein